MSPAARQDRSRRGTDQQLQPPQKPRTKPRCRSAPRRRGAPEPCVRVAKRAPRSAHEHAALRTRAPRSAHEHVVLRTRAPSTRVLLLLPPGSTQHDDAAQHGAEETFATDSRRLAACTAFDPRATLCRTGLRVSKTAPCAMLCRSGLRVPKTGPCVMAGA
jgi:hypothetical protein